MESLWKDTHPEAERVLLELARQTPPARKMALMWAFCRSARTMMLAGIRDRHPDASAAESRRHFAELVLDEELAARVIEASPTLTEISMELPPALVTVIQALETLEIPYLIGGSIAAMQYGINRSTLDADIVADLRREHIPPLVDALKADFYADGEMMLDAITRRASFNLIHYATMFKIDVFIPKNRPFDHSQLQRRVRRPIDQGIEAYFASMEDVILAKLEWYRAGNETSERQWQDILEVVKTQGDRLDREYMRKWAVELGVSDLLERALTMS